jgi:translation initiation factor IF-3
MSLRDRQIPYRTVQLVSPTDNSLSEPTPLRTILNSYDHATHTLSLVSLEPPIVKLLNKEDIRQKVRKAEVKAKLNRKSAVEEKEVQVSWASASGDLKHKCAQARGILEKGDRATVIYAAKAGSDKVSQGVQGEITAMFERELEEVAVRWKEDEKSKATWIQFWGPMAKVREERRAKVEEEEVGKKKERDEKKEARRKKEEERQERAARKAAEMVA